MTCNSVTIATLSSFDHYVSWPQKAQLQVRQLVSYFTIYTVRVHVRVTSTNPRTVTVTDGQSLASSVNKQPQAWEHYIEKLNTQLNELISRNQALLTANETTQELCNELNQARTEVVQLQAVNVHLQQQVNRLASIELSTKVQ